MKMWAGLVGLGLIGPPALAGDLIDVNRTGLVTVSLARK